MLTRFSATLLEKVNSLAAVGAAEETCEECTTGEVRAKLDEIASDIKTFRDAMCKVTAFQPSGATSDQMLFMEISTHLGKCKKYRLSGQGFYALQLSQSSWLYVLPLYLKSFDFPSSFRMINPVKENYSLRDHDYDKPKVVVYVVQHTVVND